MKTLGMLLVLVCVSLHAADDAEGLEPIFNGKDLEGWKVPDPNPWWSAKDGVLRGIQDEKLKGNVIETVKVYQDVIVEAEVKWSGDVDSGIFLRKGHRWQCQIGISRSLKKDMTCSIYVPNGGYIVKAKNVEKLLKTDDWNRIRIVAKGGHYTISLNGEVVLDSDLPGYNEPGPIGLQVHPGVKDMKVEFRNLRAKSL